MAATEQNFETWQGNSVDIAFQVTQEDGTTPVNISGATIVWKASEEEGASIKVTKSTASGITITDAAQGKFTVALSATDTNALDGVYYHEAEVTDSSSKTTTVATGWMTVHRKVA